MTSRQSLLARAATAVWRRRHPQFSLTEGSPTSPQLHLNVADLPHIATDRIAIRAGRRAASGDEPWLTREVISFLDTWLRPTDHGLEYGSGGSSAWLAARCASVISVEGSKEWGDALAKRIEATHITNLDLVIVSGDEMGNDTPEHRDAYVNVRPELAPESLDWVLVDGQYRDEAALRAVRLLKPGGLLIVDNANLYLPTKTRVSWQVDEPASPLWVEFLTVVRDWRYVWTTNGVWDTVLWFKSTVSP